MIGFFKILRNVFKRKKKNTEEISSAILPETAGKKAPEEKEDESEKYKLKPRTKRKPPVGDRPVRNRDDQLRSEKKSEGREKWDISSFDVPEMEGKTRFHDLGLPAKIMRGIQDLGFTYCTDIQAQILPETLKGKDATGQAQTGTGKTAAFLISIFTRLLAFQHHGQRRPGLPRALVLVPTRELALQVEKDAVAIGKYSRISIMSVFGGMAYEAQKRRLAEKVVDLLIATPGRLIDFMDQGLVKFYKTEIIVLDEADRMLDMGFMPDMRQIMKSVPPKNKRQTLFFSATITPEVSRLATLWTTDSMSVEIDPEQIASASVIQKNYIVTTDEKFALLYNILTRENPERVIIFANTRNETRIIDEKLRAYGLDSVILSGEISQKKRIDSLESFRGGKSRILVATDVAARGLHVDGVSHVINYNFPQDPEHYVHRIGRTGRAGATGISISFASEDDAFYIPAAEKLIGSSLVFEHPDDDWFVLPEPPPKKARQEPSAQRKGDGYQIKRKYPQRKKSAHGQSFSGKQVKENRADF